MKKDEIVKYWLDSSDIDFKAMDSLFNNGHYVWTLFVGHLVIEKLLKAYYVKVVDNNAPQIHHLLQIAERSGLALSDSQKDFLLEVTTFNLKARYPDYKQRFYKKATKSFAEEYMNKIKEFRTWLLKTF
ncbi:MAG: HEPN domain-containing protein [Deltaproteobacteria bacterium]|nr:HEPN domain-containing protein [Deltaproteobacteria bacterium]